MTYYLARLLSRIIFKTVFRLKVTGKENLPDGGFIIASNHNSLIDPPLVGAALRQPVYFMAKKELFEIPIFGALIRSTHAFPVDRTAPELSSIKKAISLLKSGKVLLIFPEGTRKTTGKIHRGIVLLAHKAGVPVVPSKIYNNENIRKLLQIRYVIGKPMTILPESGKRVSSKTYRQFVSQVMEEIKAL